MKTNKINVVLSLNKTVVSNYENSESQLAISGAACAGGKTIRTGATIVKTGTITNDIKCISDGQGHCDLGTIATSTSFFCF